MKLLPKMTSAAKWLTILAIVPAFLGACGVQTAAEQKGFSATAGAKNIAVIMTGSHEQHIPKNAGMIREVMSEQAYNFQIMEQQRVTAAQAIQLTANAAAQVDDNGTLLWYFSSHGATNGTLQTFGGMLSFDKVAAAIKTARNGRPLKRLVVIVQACYSGQIVNGSLAVGRTDYPLGATGLGLMAKDTTAGLEQDLRDDANLAAYTNQLLGINNGTRSESAPLVATNPATGKLAEQLLVMSAAARNEPSMYSGDGSHFTKALYTTFKQMRSTPQITMQQFLARVQQNVSSSRPQFRAVPEALVLSEPLYTSMGSGSAVASTTNNVAATTSVQNLALMVKGSGTATQIYVSAQPGTSKILVCEGTIAVCSQPAAQRAEIPSFGNTSTGNRTMFASNWTFKANTTYSVLAVDTAGKVLTSRSVQFKPRQLQQ